MYMGLSLIKCHNIIVCIAQFLHPTNIRHLSLMRNPIDERTILHIIFCLELTLLYIHVYIYRIIHYSTLTRGVSTYMGLHVTSSNKILGEKRDK